ncbi:MAG: hypothetical protein ABIE70_09925 [bacterium]
MKTSLIRLTIVLAILASTVAAQDTDADRLGLGLYMPFDFVGGGVRAEGMGNAFLGVSDDVTAGGWNPAGLVVHEGPMLGLSYGATSAKGKTDFTIFSRTFGADHDGSLGGVSDLNFVAPFRLKGHPFVGSFNYTENFSGLGNQSFNATVGVPIWVIRQSILQQEIFPVDVVNKQSYEGSLRSVNIAFGSRVYENISLGLAVNVYSGSAIRTITELTAVYDFPLPPFEQSVTAGGTGLVVDTSKFSGFNFTLGAKHSGEKLSWGLALRSPFNLNVKTGTSLYSVQDINGFPIEAGTDTTFIDDQLTKYSMPFLVGGGIGYQLKDNLLLAVDAEYRGYGSTGIKDRTSLNITPAGNIEEDFIEYDDSLVNWNNGVSMRFGAEYTMAKSFGTIPLRVGVGFVPTPRPNDGDVETPAKAFILPHAVISPLAKLLNKSDAALQYTFSLGTGIHWNQIHLDWSYTYSWVDRSTITDADAREDVTVELVLESQTRDHHFGFGFTGYF